MRDESLGGNRKRKALSHPRYPRSQKRDLGHPAVEVDGVGFIESGE